MATRKYFITAFCLTVLLLILSIPAALANYTTSVNSFLNDSRWMHGTAWDGNQTPKMDGNKSYWGCAAYACDFSRYVWGSYAYQGGIQFWDTSEIRDGDVLLIYRYNEAGQYESHYYVVLQVKPDGAFWTAEGNVWYNEWGTDCRVLVTDNKYSRSSVCTQYTYFECGWHNPNYEPYGNVTYLDVNGWLDGALASSVGSYGTFDVYIDDVLVSSGTNDYYNTALPIGSRYRITNVAATDGCYYQGLISGSLEGVLTADGAQVVLKFASLESTFVASLEVTGSGRFDGFLLRAAGGETINIVAGGLAAQYYGEKRTVSTEWRFVRQSDDTYKIYPVWNQTLLLTGAAAGNSVTLEEASAGKRDYQCWYVRKSGDYYYLSPRASASDCLWLNPNAGTGGGMCEIAAYSAGSGQLVALHRYYSNVAPTAIQNVPHYVYLSVGSSYTVNPTVEPENVSSDLQGIEHAFYTTISHPSYKNIKTVDENYTVTATRSGTSRISFHSSYNGVESVCVFITPNMPESLTRIEEEAFAGSGIMVFILPNTCQSIGKRAFADLTIGDVVIPPSVISIAPDAFENYENGMLSIYTIKGSPADEILTQYGIRHTSW